MVDKGTKEYLHELTPKKPYVKKKLTFRGRKPFELFWDEILIALVILAMLVMLFINIYSAYTVQEPSRVNQSIDEVDITVDVEEFLQYSTDQQSGLADGSDFA